MYKLLYKYTYIHLNDEQKTNILQEISRVLKKHQVKLSKNDIIKEIASTASRATIYSIWDEIENSGILKTEQITPRRKKYYLSEHFEVIQHYRESLQKIRELLDFVRDNPTLGDCFGADKKIELPLTKISSKQTKEFTTRGSIIGFDQLLGNGKNLPYLHVYSVRARHDILKELPTFLTFYINKLDNNLSDVIRKELINEAYPLIIECFQLLQHEYPDLSNCSIQFAEQIRIPLKDYAARVQDVLGPYDQDPLVEFIRILGRYHFCISTNYESMKNKDKADLDRIAEIIKFLYKPLMWKFQFEKYLKENDLQNNVDKNHLQTKKTVLETHELSDKERKSVSTKMLRGIILMDRNPDHKIVLNHYLDLFIKLDLFTTSEKQEINRLRQDAIFL